MDNVKQWYQSRTIWGALIAIGASVAHLSGWTLSSADQGQIVDSALSMSGALGGLIALYGRLKADARVG